MMVETMPITIVEAAASRTGCRLLFIASAQCHGNQRAAAGAYHEAQAAKRLQEWVDQVQSRKCRFTGKIRDKKATTTQYTEVKIIMIMGDATKRSRRPVVKWSDNWIRSLLIGSPFYVHLFFLLTV